MPRPSCGSSTGPGGPSVAEALAARRREQAGLLELARAYVERLRGRVPVRAAAVVGSVARGDFNLWSDVDVVVVAEGLPERIPDRSATLVADAPPRVQPVGFLPEEFRVAWRKGNPLAREAADGVVLVGKEYLEALVAADRPSS
jgi:predicted nucleotidyltransferase